MLQKPQMRTDFFLFSTMGKLFPGSTQIPVQGVQSLTSHLPLEESLRLSGTIPHSFIRSHRGAAAQQLLLSVI